MKFQNLGLLIIDEEQRFGVEQKEQLKFAAKGTDILTLSATPIPRTLQLSLANTLDFTLLNSPPRGRKPVKVLVTYDIDYEVVVNGIAAEVERNGQVFIVVPYIKHLGEVEKKLHDINPGLKGRVIQVCSQTKDLEDRIGAFLRKEVGTCFVSTCKFL